MRRLADFVMRRCIAAMLAAAVAAYAVMLPAQAQPNTAGFHRGIGVAHDMAWAPLKPGPSRDFAFPPSGDSTKRLAEELKVLHRTGFDFIRLAVDPGPFLQFQGSRRDRLDDFLLERVKLILAVGLSVIVDFHPSDLHPDYTAEALTRGANTPLFRDYVRLLVRTATLLERLQSPKVALELMNEPPIGPAQWLPMLEATYQAVRERAPRIPLVLEGGDEASIDGMLSLAGFSQDQRALLSFHNYDPYQFTHQGAPWNPARYLADVPYPASARPLQQSLDASAALIAKANISSAEKSRALVDARQRLEAYRKSAFGRKQISATFDRVAGWIRQRGVAADRVMLGEFGARKEEGPLAASRISERAEWFRDMRQEAEARGFAWAAWVYRGSGGFALVKSQSSLELEPPITGALGLDSQ